MLLTEEDAKRKWCPKAISLYREKGYYGSGDGMAGINRDSPSGNIPSCIASFCMAWRWHDPKKLRDIDLVTSDVVDQEPRRGYCGAFGVPQHED